MEKKDILSIKIDNVTIYESLENARDTNHRKSIVEHFLIECYKIKTREFVIKEKYLFEIMDKVNTENKLLRDKLDKQQKKM